MESTTTKPDVRVRWMIRSDMEEVLDIEKACFEFPWDENNFVRCLRQRNVIGMVTEYERRVVGYMVYELNRDHFHLLNLAVDSYARYNGFGRQMIQKLIKRLVAGKRSCIRTEIRETNLDAQLFFRTLGFRAVGVLHDYYDDSNDDAYVMERWR